MRSAGLAARPHGRAPGDTAGALRSGVYEGTVVHRRPGRGGHGFTQALITALVYLDECDELCRRHPCWSVRRPAPVWWRRADFLGDPRVPLDRAVRDLVEGRTGSRPTGPIALLATPRTWGWAFNPISCYFCWSTEGGGVTAIVAEVTNTPWHERHSYVVGGTGEHLIDKALHVSPFLGMDVSYRARFSEPGEVIDVRFDVIGGGVTQLAAGMRLRRLGDDRASLGRLMWSPGRGPAAVSAGIYRQAATSWASGATVHRHPSERGVAGARWTRDDRHG